MSSLDRATSERKAKATSAGGDGTPTRAASVFKLPVLPLSEATTPNTTSTTAKKRKAHEKAKTPRDASAIAAAITPSAGESTATPLERGTSNKKSRATAHASTPHVASMREATRLWATPTPTNTPLKPSHSFAAASSDFEPSHGVPAFLLTDYKAATVPESPRTAMRASAMVDQAFQNAHGEPLIGVCTF